MAAFECGPATIHYDLEGPDDRTAQRTAADPEGLVALADTHVAQLRPDGGRVRSNIGVQEARTEELLGRYEQTVLQAYEDVENSMVSFVQEQERAFLLIPVGYPASDAKVPDIQRKPLDKVIIWK